MDHFQWLLEFNHANSSWVRVGELNRNQGFLDVQIKNRNRWITYRYYAGTESLRRLSFSWRSDRISSGRFIASLRGVSKKVRKKFTGQRFRNIYSGFKPERSSLPTYLQHGFPRNFPNILTRPLKEILSGVAFNKITMPKKDTLSLKVFITEKSISGKRRLIRSAYKKEFNNAIIGIGQVGKNVTINIPIRKLNKYLGKR